MNTIDCLVIGGGSAGLAAAISAKENGIDQILVLEKESEAGGILQQCIHNGFGLHTFKEELAGPEYAHRYIVKANELHIDVRVETTVLSVSEDKVVRYSNAKEGIVSVKAKSIILATGCRERTAGNILMPSKRPTGVWTAGTAQKYVNIDGYMVGKRVLILGSGDIGLIMARRMTLEGAKVEAVAEIMPYSNGLTRNIVQCLHDYDIPLYLSHTVISVEGKERVEAVVLAEVDEYKQPIKGTEKRFEVDTLLLSVGLIPENTMAEDMGVELSPITKGAIIDHQYQCSVEGVFACGNALLVHDVVDYVSEQGALAGKFAAKYLKGGLTQEKGMPILAQGEASFVVPQLLKTTADESVKLYYRIKQPMKKAKVMIKHQGEVVFEQVKNHLVPAEMEQLVLKPELIAKLSDECVLEVINLGN